MKAKIIKLYDTIYDIRTLYRKANTPAQRALASYIVKAGMTNDSIFGGAFKLLCDVEFCTSSKDIYKINCYVDSETESKITYVAQMALDGKFDCFMMKKSEMDAIVKALAEF